MSITIWFVRLVLLFQGLMAAVQPVLAGSFMSGNYDALTVHSGVGGSMFLVTALALLAVVAHGAAGSRLWPVGLHVLLLVAVIMQIAVGSTRNLALHIPLGVALVAVMVWLAIWAWLPGARLRRTYLVRRRKAPAVPPVPTSQGVAQ
ncbi:hypothetical protein [Nocardioides speluncae]|uniref:hypothetical protein n=1 Tax=Nocardioides speluncae TaxID=2670337 RepID=UPI000D692794|nr:hypothetical protein [Nocardioides speluncae]